MIVWKDNTDKKEMELYPLERQYDWNPRINDNEVHPYDDIDVKSDIFLSLITPDSSFFDKKCK